MKRILYVLLLAVALASCTRQNIARRLGGNLTIELPAGQELMMVTWKEDDLFYLTKPMSSDYVPVTKTFQESSSFGVLETTVVFVETK